MDTHRSDGGEERRHENALDAQVRIPHFRDGVERSSSDLSAALMRLGDTSALDALRDAVASFARASRNGNVPPEQMLIRLKRLLRQSRSEQDVGLARQGDLERRVVDAAIADYFAPPYN